MAIHHETGVIAAIDEGSFKGSSGRDVPQILATIKVYSSRVDAAGQTISQVNSMQVETTNEDVMRRLRATPKNTFIQFDFVISGRSYTRGDNKSGFVNNIRLLNFQELRVLSVEESNGNGADGEVDA